MGAYSRLGAYSNKYGISVKFSWFKFTADPGGKGPHFCLTLDKITFRLIVQ